MRVIDGWQSRPLDDICSLIKDGSHGTHQDVLEGIPFLSAKDVRDGLLQIPEDCRRISIKDYKSIHKSYEIKRGDILLTIVGTIGRSCMVTGAEPSFSIQRSVGVIRSAQIKSEYLYQYIKSDQFQTSLNDATNASAQGGVYLGSLAKCSVFYPKDPAEQSKIAEILSTIDRAIEQTEALIAKQQRIKAGLMQDLLTCGIDEQGNLRSEETHEFKDSLLGRISVEWDVTPANSLCSAVIDCKNRTPPVRNDGHPVIRTPNVRDGKFVYEDLAFTDERSYEIWTARGKPMVGDVVITREAPFGEACLIPEDMSDACLGQRMMLYKTDPKALESRYMLFAIYSESVQKRLLELAGGSTVGHVRVGEIKSLPIPHPIRLDEQKRIADVLTGIATYIDQQQEELQKLRLLKNALMQDLLTGKHRVTVLLPKPEEATT
jgi:type I restriction enzyme S subunit